MIMVDELVRWPQAPKPGAERYFGNGKPSCHLMTDGDVEELHTFAQAIGCRRRWWQGDHYDLTPGFRAKALRGVRINGQWVRAQFVSTTARLQQAGLLPVGETP